jgi:pimeloyl-ACP methyl ester carboxylesterase
MKHPFFVVVLIALLQPATSLADEAIELSTPTGTIHGTLLLPADASIETPVPVVLIIAGSGPTNRNGNSALLAAGNDSLKMLAEALAEAGFASVRYDKRGIAASAAAGLVEADLRFEHYVEDASAWLLQLSGDSRFSSVGVIGHSEGALIGMLAAEKAAVPFVSIAGAATDAATLIRHQLQDRLPAELAAPAEQILAALEAGELVADVPPQLAWLYRPSVQPYMISWIKYDPSEEIKKLSAPCLILQGTTDVQVSWSDAEALHAANGACDINVIGGMNHIMKAVPDDLQQQIASYSDPSLPLEPKFTVILVDFLRRSLPPSAAAAP